MTINIGGTGGDAGANGNGGDNQNTGDNSGGKTNINANAVTDLFKGLPAETAQFYETNGFTKAETPQALFENLAKSYGELSQKVSSTPTIPKADASDEDWKKFVEAVRPEKPDAYKFNLPADIPQDFPYDSEFAKAFQATAHEAGLHPRQAAALHDWFVKSSASQFSTTIDQVNRETTEATQALVKQWGNPDSGTYKENITNVQRSIKALGGEALTKELVKLGAITEKGDVRSPALISALATVGSALFKEDSLVPGNGGGGVPGGDNPFKKGSENMTRQGQIIKQDPNLAKRLMQQAGVSPSEYGM